MLQSWKERARTRAAHPQEGGHQNTRFGRRDRPRRPGEHALPGLLQRQGQTDQRSAVWGVSDNQGTRAQKVIYKTTHEADWKGGRRWDGEEKYIRDCLTNCQLDELFHLISCDDQPSFCSSLNCWVLSSRSSLFVSTGTTRKRWSTSCYWTGRRGIPATRTRTCHHATRSVGQSNQYLSLVHTWMPQRLFGVLLISLERMVISPTWLNFNTFGHPLNPLGFGSAGFVNMLRMFIQ